MKFTMFASGSKGNSFLAESRKTKILIDCGTTRKYLKNCMDAVHVSVSDLDAVVITHAHSDHVSQIAMFKDCRIYSPVKLPDISAEIVRPGMDIEIGDMILSPLALSHDASNTTGYILKCQNEQLDYVTDTGYLNSAYYPALKNADYIIMESNHDISMLMESRRPQYVKSRICSDYGHLCNEDCARILDQIVTERTQSIILAHISQEANTCEKALAVNREYLLKQHAGKLNPALMLHAAGQYEMIQGGEDNEKVDSSSCCCAIGLEYMSERVGGGHTDAALCQPDCLRK